MVMISLSFCRCVQKSNHKNSDNHDNDVVICLFTDSGHSTLRDLNDATDDTEIDSVSVQSEIRRGRQHKRVHPSLREQEEDVSIQYIYFLISI